MKDEWTVRLLITFPICVAFEPDSYLFHSKQKQNEEKLDT
jgi:hypothetical protein